MKEGRRRRTVSRPFTAPQAVPTASASSAAGRRPSPSLTRPSPSAALERAITEPTDRSMAADEKDEGQAHRGDDQLRDLVGDRAQGRGGEKPVGGQRERQHETPRARGGGPAASRADPRRHARPVGSRGAFLGDRVRGSGHRGGHHRLRRPFAAPERGRHAAAGQDQDAVGEGQTARRSPTTRRRSPCPAPASSRSRRWTSARAPTSTPRVGSSTRSTAGSRRRARPRRTFCWLPPESWSTGWSRDRARTPERLDDRSGQAVLHRAPGRFRRGQPPDGASRGSRWPEPRTAAASPASCDPRSGRPRPSRTASDGRAMRAGVVDEPRNTRPDGGPVGAEDAAQHLRPARAHEAGQAQDLALAHLEAHVPVARAREAIDAQGDLALGRRRPWRSLRDGPPDHEADDLVAGQLPGGAGRDQAAVAQDADHGRPCAPPPRGDG